MTSTIDNSALSRAKKTVTELEQSLAVMARQAEIEGRYGDLDGPSAYLDPHRDVVKEVDEQFGPSNTPKAGDKKPLIVAVVHARAGSKPAV